MARNSILAVLVYVFHKDEGSEESSKESSEQVLLIHRNTRDLSRDDHAGKWNGLGGKCEKDEALLTTAARELFEESGLRVPESRFKFLGFLQFPNFKPHKDEDWNVGVFSVEATNAERSAPLVKCSEGTLHWIAIQKVSTLPFWPGDEKFLPHVFKREPFFGVIRYAEGEVIGADIRRI